MLLFTGGVKSWSVVSALQDLGMIVVATGTEKSTEEDKARIMKLMGPDAKMISDNDQKALIDAFHEFERDILIAGGRYLYPALKSRIPFLDMDQSATLDMRDMTASSNSRVSSAFRSTRRSGVKYRAELPWASATPIANAAE